MREKKCPEGITQWPRSKAISYARQIRMLNTRATTVKGGRTLGEETTLELRILV